MYKLNVWSDFSAAHKLLDYEGKCKNLHGHNWKVRIGIECKKTDKAGLTIDFTEVKAYLKKILEQLDHSLLNDLEIFENINPTSENISKYIYKELEARIDKKDCKISDVEIWESERSSMIYYEND